MDPGTGRDGVIFSKRFTGALVWPGTALTLPSDRVKILNLNYIFASLHSVRETLTWAAPGTSASFKLHKY